MQVGMEQIFQSWGDPGCSDAQVYDEELKLAVMADQLGIDEVWVVEHHFEDYSFCPDNFVYLAHVAALTKRIKLATGAVILPWNTQPLRVAEKAAMLDQLSGGRFMLGFGRGLSRREYDQFGISMDEARGRFDEAAPMIIKALETGVMEEHHGKYFDQPRAVIRPHPKSFKDRIKQVAMSSDSLEEAAQLGVQIMQFTYKPIEVHQQEIATYSAAFRKHHARAAPIPIMTDITVCDTNADRAAENAHKYIRNYLLSVMHHYEMMGEHFKSAKGYEAYGDAATAMQSMGLDAVADGYVKGQVWGTPQQMLEGFEKRRRVLGDYDILMIPRFAGIPFEVAARTLKVFAEQVVPELKSWDTVATQAA
ncbi:MAG: LLM class flavin-dependent oxidoreductase [Gammaproteobacteria bacterium]|nr:LLM class flavin-dependent oxidoreductase [Gammaproteobacteria bacterium]